MKLLFAGAACALALFVAGAPPALAQTAAPGATAGGQTKTTEAKPARKPRAAKKPAREPTVGQMAARERQKKCGVEWREAKTAGKTGGDKWPQFWSKCNARLKGSQV